MNGQSPAPRPSRTGPPRIGSKPPSGDRLQPRSVPGLHPWRRARPPTRGRDPTSFLSAVPPHCWAGTDRADEGGQQPSGDGSGHPCVGGIARPWIVGNQRRPSIGGVWNQCKEGRKRPGGPSTRQPHPPTSPPIPCRAGMNGLAGTNGHAGSTSQAGTNGYTETNGHTGTKRHAETNGRGMRALPSSPTRMLLFPGVLLTLGVPLFPGVLLSSAVSLSRLGCCSGRC
jgi:hypothetical protein